MPEKNHDRDPVPLMTRFFRACLLLLAGVIAICIALHLLAQYWMWLTLVAAVAGLVWGAVWFIGRRRDRRW